MFKVFFCAMLIFVGSLSYAKGGFSGGARGVSVSRSFSSSSFRSSSYSAPKSSSFTSSSGSARAVSVPATSKSSYSSYSAPITNVPRSTTATRPYSYDGGYSTPRTVVYNNGGGSDMLTGVLIGNMMSSGSRNSTVYATPVTQTSANVSSEPAGYAKNYTPAKAIEYEATHRAPFNWFGFFAWTFVISAGLFILTLVGYKVYQIKTRTKVRRVSF